MNKFFLLLTLSMMVTLTACQQGPQGTSPVGTSVAPKLGGSGGGTPTSPGGGSAPAPGGSSGNGGVDPTGGGNGINGVSLDNYKIKINDLPAFTRIKENVIARLAKRFPKLAGDLMFVAEGKTWYRIKTQLNTLPSAKIGVSFKTEQFALQNVSEIWINDLIYVDMKDRDQDGLILHEMVMGVRLLEFANELDRCLASVEYFKLDPATAESYPEKRRECFKKNKLASDLGQAAMGLGRTIKLEDFDYFSIRTLTAQLMEEVDSINAEELEDWMSIRNFRKY
ncbi:MAG: hypothetical protein H7326_10960 [Bdellovibrionaceae bacterium]|nr:hypothetical protein [Pseudobdellovibrionaceae bacterium]